MADLSVAVVETPVTTEWLVLGQSPGITFSDVLVTDTPFVAPELLITVAESITATDSPSGFFFPSLNAIGIETITVTDAPAFQVLSYIAVVEAIHSLDVPTTLIPFLLPTVAESIVTADIFTGRYAEFLLHIIELQGLTDAPAFTGTLFAAILESVVTIDVPTVNLGIAVIAGESVVTTEALQTQTQPTVREQIATLDAATVLLVSFVADLESITVVEMAGIGLTLLISNTVDLESVHTTDAPSLQVPIPPVAVAESVMVMDAPTLLTTVAITDIETVGVTEHPSAAGSVTTGFQIHVAEMVATQDRPTEDTIYRWVQQTAEVAPTY